tara:strand:- start:468 stop:824 length:357 start_codon:yes stop_codon:yes gene_type:complete
MINTADTANRACLGRLETLREALQETQAALALSEAALLGCIARLKRVESDDDAADAAALDSAFDRGSADYYYNRASDAHLIDDSGKRVAGKDLTGNQRASYEAGYASLVPSARKNWEY